MAAEGGGFLCVAVGAEERQVAGDAAGEMRALLSWAPRASPAAPRPRVRVRVASFIGPPSMGGDELLLYGDEPLIHLFISVSRGRP